MAYVIKHIETGKYVAPPGQQRSYTRKLELARKFDSLAAAEAECCVENERILTLEEAAGC